MSKQYICTEDQGILLQEGAIIWNDTLPDQSSLHYYDANDTEIEDCTINESYATAIDSNETQYLSALESSNPNEITLEDLHSLTIDNENVDEAGLEEEPISEKSVTNNDSGVVLFTMEGSDDIYGIQLAQDEEGNIQKYQFKFRSTEEGQLEPIPETVTLLTDEIHADSDIIAQEELDTEEFLLLQSQEMQNENQYQDIEQVFIKGENNEHSENCEDERSSDVNSRVVTRHEVAENLNHCLQSDLVDKGNLISGSYLTSTLNVENEEHVSSTNEDEEYVDENMFENTIAICQEDQEQQLNQMIAENEIPPLTEISSTRTYLNRAKEQNHGNSVEQFLNENRFEVQYETELEQTERPPEENQDMAYVDDYLENVSSNVELNYSQGDAAKVESSIILRQPLVDTSVDDKTKKPGLNVKYYVVYQEKENMALLADANAALPELHFQKNNPRSILRTSFTKQKIKNEKPEKDSLPECDLFHKRFARNKDAMQAKHFHNFLNKTTIPHAPVRQQRQPRKQEIKPIIERSCEEIIVQEVIVSSSGFVESTNRKVADNKTQITAFVELSDSEEDSINKANSNQKKRVKKPNLKANVIEIHSDNEAEAAGTLSPAKLIKVSSEKEALSPSKKRKRGRPRKLPRYSKKRRAASSDDCIVSESDTVKREIICPYCPKTFPSQNSLNTHIIHHNLENSLKNKAKMGSKGLPRQTLLPKMEYNHKCETCLQTFKNTVLLNKHQCTKKENLYCCSLCLKQFRDITLFNIHKKSHAKSNLVQNTSAVKISPKKLYQKPSPSLNTFKCRDCLRAFTNEEKLNLHMKSHQKFICSSCLMPFSSKLLLDDHIRTNCVKLKTNTKRLSLVVKKSFINTPPRRLSIVKRNCNQSILGVKHECDICKNTFHTYRSLYIHKVQEHGMNTPDKSLMSKPKKGIYKPKPAHGGIPANERMRKAYAALRQKMAEVGDLVPK